MRTENVLITARFDPRLPKYWLLQAVVGLAITLVGIPLILPVLVLGPVLFKKWYEALECDLTDRSLHIRRGVVFRKEKNIPLDKIQDIGTTEGPLLRRFGLAKMRIETAGQTAQGMADAQLVGIVDMLAFRDAVLEQRDLVSGFGRPQAPKTEAAPTTAEGGDEVLREIRDTLLRIEKRLDESSSGGV